MTRKEALDVLRKNIPTDKSLPVYEALQTLITELRESEDERIRKIIYNCVYECCDTGYLLKDDRNSVVAWLEKQKEQKPEWSEEDVDMLNSCISSIEEAKENRYAYKETDGDTSYDHEIAWLKALRPSWKPSEHQMTILKAVKDYVGKGSGYWGEALSSLIEDLKKL